MPGLGLGLGANPMLPVYVDGSVQLYYQMLDFIAKFYSLIYQNTHWLIMVTTLVFVFELVTTGFDIKKVKIGNYAEIYASALLLFSLQCGINIIKWPDDDFYLSSHSTDNSYEASEYVSNFPLIPGLFLSMSSSLDKFLSHLMAQGFYASNKATDSASHSFFSTQKLEAYKKVLNQTIKDPILVNAYIRFMHYGIMQPLVDTINKNRDASSSSSDIIKDLFKKNTVAEVLEGMFFDSKDISGAGKVFIDKLAPKLRTEEISFFSTENVNINQYYTLAEKKELNKKGVLGKEVQLTWLQYYEYILNKLKAYFEKKLENMPPAQRQLILTDIKLKMEKENARAGADASSMSKFGQQANQFSNDYIMALAVSSFINRSATGGDPTTSFAVSQTLAEQMNGAKTKYFISSEVFPVTKNMLILFLSFSFIFMYILIHFPFGPKMVRRFYSTFGILLLWGPALKFVDILIDKASQGAIVGELASTVLGGGMTQVSVFNNDQIIYYSALTLYGLVTALLWSLSGTGLDRIATGLSGGLVNAAGQKAEAYTSGNVQIGSRGYSSYSADGVSALNTNIGNMSESGISAQQETEALKLMNAGGKDSALGKALSQNGGAEWDEDAKKWKMKDSSKFTYGLSALTSRGTFAGLNAALGIRPTEKGALGYYWKSAYNNQENTQLQYSKIKRAIQNGKFGQSDLTQLIHSQMNGANSSTYSRSGIKTTSGSQGKTANSSVSTNFTASTKIPEAATLVLPIDTSQSVNKSGQKNNTSSLTQGYSTSEQAASSGGYNTDNWANDFGQELETLSQNQPAYDDAVKALKNGDANKMYDLVSKSGQFKNNPTFATATNKMFYSMLSGDTQKKVGNMLQLGKLSQAEQQQIQSGFFAGGVDGGLKSLTEDAMVAKDIAGINGVKRIDDAPRRLVTAEEAKNVVLNSKGAVGNVKGNAAWLEKQGGLKALKPILKARKAIATTALNTYKAAKQEWNEGKAGVKAAGGFNAYLNKKMSTALSGMGDKIKQLGQGGQQFIKDIKSGAAQENAEKFFGNQIQNAENTIKQVADLAPKAVDGVKNVLPTKAFDNMRKSFTNYMNPSKHIEAQAKMQNLIGTYLRANHMGGVDGDHLSFTTMSPEEAEKQFFTYLKDGEPDGSGLAKALGMSKEEIDDMRKKHPGQMAEFAQRQKSLLNGDHKQSVDQAFGQVGLKY